MCQFDPWIPWVDRKPGFAIQTPQRMEYIQPAPDSFVPSGMPALLIIIFAYLMILIFNHI
jgi:hypothetical protein